MRPLIVLAARSAALAVTVVLVLGLTGGLVRLLPWLVAPEVPARLALPFARLLGGAAAETAILLGLPLGVALGSASFVERGEARALGALGASPWRLVGPLTAPAAGLVVLYVALASTADPEPPGRLAARLVAAGRASCAAKSTFGRVDVPLVAVSWLCLANGPRLAGRVPGLGDGAWFTATDLRPGLELGSAAFDDLHLATDVGGRAATVRVREARVVGLPRWGKSLALSGAARAGVVGGAALGLSLAAAWLVVRRAVASPLAAAALAGCAVLGTLFALRTADSHGFSPAGYAVVPASGLLLLAAVAAGWDLGRQIAGGRAG